MGRGRLRVYVLEETKMKDGLDGLFQQAQQMKEQMQEQMKKAEEAVDKLEVHGESGAGMVKIIMSGRHDVKSIQIDESLVAKLSQDEREMLEDLLSAAFRDCVKKVEQANKENMASLTAGINFPPGFKMPF